VSKKCPHYKSYCHCPLRKKGEEKLCIQSSVMHPEADTCYRFQRARADAALAALADLKTVAEGLAEALNATGLGRHHRRKPDWMDEAIDAYDAWKEKNP